MERNAGDTWGCGHPGPACSPLPGGGHWGPPVVSCHRRLCSDRVACLGLQGRGCGYPALGAAAPRSPPPAGLGCGAVTCPWPSSGFPLAGERLSFLPYRKTPTSQPLPFPACRPQDGRDGRVHSFTAAPSPQCLPATFGCCFWLAGLAESLRPWHLAAEPLATRYVAAAQAAVPASWWWRAPSSL